MDSEIVESIGTVDDMTVDETSFAWAVDSAIRSRTPSILGASRVRSFASLVDSMIGSRTPSNLGTSPVRGFASSVDMRTVATRLSQAVSKPTTHVHGFQLYTFSELVAATNHFSTDYKIGEGTFGVAYKGYLQDGHVVAIKRVAKSGSNTESQQKEIDFVSELSFLSRLRERYFNFKIKRGKTLSMGKEFQEQVGYLLTFLPHLHHRNLVGLVGFCEEKDERLLVYEYMQNEALYDHLHDKNNIEKGSSVLNSWRMRIKIALDASRGIEYLHNYAVPSILHRNIKSRTILLDSNWTARVSGFELSLISPEPDGEYEDIVMGTMVYLDPEYFRRGVVTAKSDVYGLGVVLLELLTGKKPIFTYGGDGSTLTSVTKFALDAIFAGESAKILDSRVGPPDVNEAEAVELVAYTALHCLNWEGKDRPTMADIVINLERALAICDSTLDSNSSGNISMTDWRIINA